MNEIVLVNNIQSCTICDQQAVAEQRQQYLRAWERAIITVAYSRFNGGLERSPLDSSGFTKAFHSELDKLGVEVLWPINVVYENQEGRNVLRTMFFLPCVNQVLSEGGDNNYGCGSFIGFEEKNIFHTNINE